MILYTLFTKIKVYYVYLRSCFFTTLHFPLDKFYRKIVFIGYLFSGSKNYSSFCEPAYRADLPVLVYFLFYYKAFFLAGFAFGFTGTVFIDLVWPGDGGRFAIVEDVQTTIEVAQNHLHQVPVPSPDSEQVVPYDRMKRRLVVSAVVGVGGYLFACAFIGTWEVINGIWGLGWPNRK